MYCTQWEHISTVRHVNDGRAVWMWRDVCSGEACVVVITCWQRLSAVDHTCQSTLTLSCHSCHSGEPTCLSHLYDVFSYLYNVSHWYSELFFSASSPAMWLALCSFVTEVSWLWHVLWNWLFDWAVFSSMKYEIFHQFQCILVKLHCYHSISVHTSTDSNQCVWLIV